MFGQSNDAMADALKNANLGAPTGTPTEPSSLTDKQPEVPTPQVEAPVEPKAEVPTPVVDTAPVVESPKVVDGVAGKDGITDTGLGEAKNAEAKTESTPVAEKTEVVPEVIKTWDEQLAEKTGGNFKNFEDVQKAMDTYKTAAETDQFHSDEIKRYNELAKQGIVFDKKFWEVQGKDYKAISNSEELILEKMATLENYEGYSKQDLQDEFNLKYDKSNWSIEGEDPTDIENVMRRRIQRDSDNALVELLSNQEKLNVVTKEDPEAVARQIVEQEKQQENWNSHIDSFAGETTKLTTVVDSKSNKSVEFEVSQEDHREASDMMKRFNTDVSAYFDQFKNADGTWDNKAIYRSYLVLKRHDDIVRVGDANAEARGRATEVTDLKNTSFKQDGVATPKAQPNKNAEAEAIAGSLRL